MLQYFWTFFFIYSQLRSILTTLELDIIDIDLGLELGLELDLELDLGLDLGLKLVIHTLYNFFFLHILFTFLFTQFPTRKKVRPANQNLCPVKTMSCKKTDNLY